MHPVELELILEM